jgi:hypothetical protein
MARILAQDGYRAAARVKTMQRWHAGSDGACRAGHCLLELSSGRSLHRLDRATCLSASRPALALRTPPSMFRWSAGGRARRAHGDGGTWPAIPGRPPVWRRNRPGPGVCPPVFAANTRVAVLHRPGLDAKPRRADLPGALQRRNRGGTICRPPVPARNSPGQDRLPGGCFRKQPLATVAARCRSAAGAMSSGSPRRSAAETAPADRTGAVLRRNNVWQPVRRLFRARQRTGHLVRDLFRRSPTRGRRRSRRSRPGSRRRQRARAKLKSRTTWAKLRP